MKKFAEAQRMLQKAISLLQESPDCDAAKVEAWHAHMSKPGLGAASLLRFAEIRMKEVQVMAESTRRARPALPRVSSPSIPLQSPPVTRSDLSPMKAAGAAGWKKAVVGQATTGSNVVLYRDGFGGNVYQPEVEASPPPRPQSWDGQRQQGGDGGGWEVQGYLPPTSIGLPSMGEVSATPPSPREMNASVARSMKRAEEARGVMVDAHDERRALERRVTELEEQLREQQASPAGRGASPTRERAATALPTMGVPTMGGDLRESLRLNFRQDVMAPAQGAGKVKATPRSALYRDNSTAPVSWRGSPKGSMMGDARQSSTSPERGDSFVTNRPTYSDPHEAGMPGRDGCLQQNARACDRGCDEAVCAVM